MKNKIKLMPLLAISASATVVPLATLTSCSKDTWYVYDLTDGTYEPGVEQFNPEPGTYYGRTTASIAYINEVEKNPKLFLDDLVYGQQDKIRYAYSSAMNASAFANVQNLKISVTTPKFGTTHVTFPQEEGTDYKTVSFKMRIDLDVKITQNDSDTVETIVHTARFDLEFKDVIWYLYASNRYSSTSYWVVGMLDDSDGALYQYQYNDNPWSIGINYTCDSVNTIKTQGEEISQKSTERYNGVIDTYEKLQAQYDKIRYPSLPTRSDNKIELFNYNFMELAIAFDFPSYHMQKVMPNSELSIRKFDARGNKMNLVAEAQPYYDVTFGDEGFMGINETLRRALSPEEPMVNVGLQNGITATKTYKIYSEDGSLQDTITATVEIAPKYGATPEQNNFFKDSANPTEFGFYTSSVAGTLKLAGNEAKTPEECAKVLLNNGVYELKLALPAIDPELPKNAVRVLYGPDSAADIPGVVYVSDPYIYLDVPGGK